MSAIRCLLVHRDWEVFVETQPYLRFECHCGHSWRIWVPFMQEDPVPDISMCSKRSCPHRASCYRYLAVPSRWQSYTRYVLGRPPAMSCEGYWDVSKERSPAVRPPGTVDAEWDQAYKDDQEET